MSVAAEWEPTDEVVVSVPAKINLALRVGARREDGYHDLVTVFQAVSLYDRVCAQFAETSITCEMTGGGSPIPQKTNLAWRAAELLKREYQVRDGVHLLVDKQIPVAGGMAGGSADAAGALLACAELWGLRASTADLMELGARLGADVPFPLLGGCALGVGRGEQLSPMLSRGIYHWVLAFRGRGLSTPEVFRQFDAMAPTTGTPPSGESSSNGSTRSRILNRPAPLAAPKELMMALTSGEAHAIGRHLVNDLQPAACALAPDLTRLLGVGQDIGCEGALVSGSGPTVAFLARDAESAADLALELSCRGIAHQVRVVTGPVPGAKIISA